MLKGIGFWSGGLSLVSMAWAGAAGAQTVNADDVAKQDILVIGKAQTLTTPESTGSRLALSPLETPASVAVIRGEEIRARGDMTVIEAETRAPGILNAGNPGNGDTALTARGFSGQGSVLQLIDGIRLFPVAGTITFPTDPWNIERIEILTGPASVLYGQGALGGAVNVITRKPTDHFVAEGEAGYGSQNTWHAAAGIGGPIAPILSYRADVSYRASDNFVDRNHTHSLALSGALKLKPSDSFSATLSEDYGDIRPTRYFGTPLINGQLVSAIRDRNYNVADAEQRFRDNQTLLKLEWSPSEVITVTNTAYRLTSKRLFKDLESYCWVGANGNCPAGLNSSAATPGNIYRTDNLGIIHDQTQWGDEGSIKLSTPIGGSIKNDLVVGFDVNSIKLIYSNDFGSATQEDSVNPYNFNPGLFYDTQGIAPRYRTKTHEASVFAEDRLRIAEALSIVGGIRAEWDKVNRWNIAYAANGTANETPAYPAGGPRKLNNTTWRVGGVYQPTKSVSLYAQYATGVDPLGTLTTYSTNASRFYFTNATGHQIEVGAKASFLDGRGSATIAAYKIVKNNLVAQRTPASPVEQIGQRSAKGIEASLSVQLPYGFAIDANGTVLDARYDNFISGGTSYTGKTPLGIPQEAANLWVSWHALDRFEARAGLRYVGHSYSDDANQFRVPGYTVADATLSYAVTKQIAIDLHLYNLFDKNYAVTTYNDQQWILGRPRSVDVSVRARF